MMKNEDWRRCNANKLKEKYRKKEIEMENYAPLIDISDIISIP